MILNKSFITHAMAISLIALSFVPSLDSTLAASLLYAGLFALSGALTNHLAIYMLFEKIPFLYGSGVIPLQFEAFKNSIKNLMMEQFFTKEQIEAFFAKEEKKIDFIPIIKETDFSIAFDALSKTVMESSFGGMLGMFGGEKVLEGLREPFTNKMRLAVCKIVETPEFAQTVQKHLKSSSLHEDIYSSVEEIIDARLAELTPQMVKEMIQKLIDEHLQWLVVWGGFFGGLIGVVSSFVL